MEKKVNVSIGQAEVLIMTNLTNHEIYARVYFEPSNRYSEGGGTLTISIPDRDLIGRHFFSHVAQSSLKEFVAQCDSPYLIEKLFKIQPYLFIEDSSEFFDWVRREGLERVKESRSSGMVSKEELRELYDDLGGRDFEGRSHFVDRMDSDLFNTMSKIYGDDWYYDLDISKPNPKYLNTEKIVTAITAELKKMVEVANV